MFHDFIQLVCTHYEQNKAEFDKEVIAWMRNAFGDVAVPHDIPPPGHVWPRKDARVVLQTPERRELTIARWGIELEVKGKTKTLLKPVVNARDDKLSSWTWKFAVSERRCLIPAASYYEFDGPPKGKWEVRFTLRERQWFFLAGLWANNSDGSRTFTMVTTSPNELAGAIHDRMPLVLDDTGAREWLGHTPLSAERLHALCRPFSSSAMLSTALPPPERPIKKSDLQSSAGDLLLE